MSLECRWGHDPDITHRTLEVRLPCVLGNVSLLVPDAGEAGVGAMRTFVGVVAHVALLVPSQCVLATEAPPTLSACVLGSGHLGRGKGHL